MTSFKSSTLNLFSNRIHLTCIASFTSTCLKDFQLKEMIKKNLFLIYLKVGNLKIVLFQSNLKKKKNSYA